MSMHGLFKERHTVSQRKGGQEPMDGKWVARLVRSNFKGLEYSTKEFRLIFQVT